MQVHYEDLEFWQAVRLPCLMVTSSYFSPLLLKTCVCACANTQYNSLEDIDYSICTLEFETRRESYYWLLEALDLYRPKVYEFARLNITRTVRLAVVVCLFTHIFYAY